MISLDTETTGADFFHGARPYFVTVCQSDGTQKYWQWLVNPRDRSISPPACDIEEISDLLADVWCRYDAAEPEDKENHVLIGHNAKFDAKALESIGIVNWPWHATRDTIVAGHVLASNHRHDLTSMVMDYLEHDIGQHEAKLEAACREARQYCRTYLPTWRIAKAGDKDLPSLSKSKGSKGEKDKGWKYDTWLPGAIARHLDYPVEHTWFKVVAEYSNADSATTLALWMALKECLYREGLWRLFVEKMKLTPILLGMERRGVSVSGAAVNSSDREMIRKSKAASDKMIGIALDHHYVLELPKGAVNNSLRSFVFDVLELERVHNPKAKSSQPSLDAKLAIPHWLATLEDDSEEKNFIKAMLSKRGADTARGFIASYRRFWKQNGHPGWYEIHPTFGQTTTDTTRMSCYNPNGQQISRKEEANLRKCFGPAPGREWWSLDAKNIELRIPAYVSGEESLIELFERPKDPPYYGSQHLLNFSKVYPDIWEKELREVGLANVGSHCKTKYEGSWYVWCKGGNFAMQYQCGPQTADRAYHREGAYKLLKNSFVKLEALNARCMASARKYGWIETIPVPSIDPYRGYRILASRSEYGDVLPTTPLNYFVQGSAGEWMHRAIVRVEPQLDEWRESGYDCWMVLTVHDELVFDFPKGRGVEPWRTNLPKIRKIQAIMESGGEDINVPTPVTVEYHAVSWGEGLVL